MTWPAMASSPSPDRCGRKNHVRNAHQVEIDRKTPSSAIELLQAAAPTNLAGASASSTIRIDGLNRWNNGQITIYRKRSSGLPDDALQSLFQDDQVRIWVSAPRGVAYFENGRFIPVS